MNKGYLTFLLFGLLALVQLYVPAGMILDREQVLAQGREFRFRSAPVDPSDPFHGKYITLDFEQDTFSLPDSQDWQAGDLIYVSLDRDKAGFARIRRVSRQEPPQAADYVKAHVAYVSREKKHHTLFIQYPFDRYYMEESKALPAEQAYAASLQDTTQVTYAQVRIKAGAAVLQEVWIGGVPIREKVGRAQQDR
jgi:uncharacterized membrane-anchored protein